MRVFSVLEDLCDFLEAPDPFVEDGAVETHPGDVDDELFDEVVFLPNAVDSLEEVSEPLLDGLEGLFLEVSDIGNGRLEEVFPDGLLEEWDPLVAEGLAEEGGDVAEDLDVEGEVIEGEPVILVADAVEDELEAAHEAEAVDQVDDDGVGVVGLFHVDRVVVRFGEEARDGVELLGYTLAVGELLWENFVVGIVDEVFALGRAGFGVELLRHGSGSADAEAGGDEVDIVRLAPATVDSAFNVLLPDSSLFDDGFFFSLSRFPVFSESDSQADIAGAVFLLDLSSGEDGGAVPDHYLVDTVDFIILLEVHSPFPVFVTYFGASGLDFYGRELKSHGAAFWVISKIIELDIFGVGGENLSAHPAEEVIFDMLLLEDINDLTGLKLELPLLETERTSDGLEENFLVKKIIFLIESLFELKNL